MKLFRISSILAAFLLVCPVASVAQTSTSLTGQVTDPSDAFVPGATVNLTNKATGAIRTDKTDATGQEGLTIGTDVTITMLPEGAATGSKQYSGTATVMDLALPLAKGAIVERSFKLKGNGALTIGLAP